MLQVTLTVPGLFLDRQQGRSQGLEKWEHTVKMQGGNTTKKGRYTKKKYGKFIVHEW